MRVLKIRPQLLSDIFEGKTDFSDYNPWNEINRGYPTEQDNTHVDSIEIPYDKRIGSIVEESSQTRRVVQISNSK